MKLPIRIISSAGYDLAWLTSQHPEARDGLPVVVYDGKAGRLADFAIMETTEELLRGAYHQGIEHSLRALHRLLAGGEVTA
jgi:hypothetical protein